MRSPRHIISKSMALLSVSLCSLYSSPDRSVTIDIVNFMIIRAYSESGFSPDGMAASLKPAPLTRASTRSKVVIPANLPVSANLSPPS
ncbi:hypothetical protein KC19_7G126400 [Ceratodon purpureus]|uniref:Secreted protein n=1 Tax=Ceratodon purpureus TaxID=3225 RepID=A0A8T0H900_CERPU|nr:hypothetical protein KC19_7G126400 [Ceratodon purpureus]